MDSSATLGRIIDEDQATDFNNILALILPPKTDTSYTLEQIEDTVAKFHDEIESVQRESNDKFDSILKSPVREQLKNLTSDLEQTLSKVTQLQNDTANTRKQLELVKHACDDSTVRERQEMIKKEEELKKSLQQSKFDSIVEFLNCFISHLENSAATCRKLLTRSSASYLQSFDWVQYHQALFLIRACGQTIHDLDTFERMYQSCKDFYGLSFRQPVNKIDMNNFIEFHATYSLETQVDVILNGHGDRCVLGEFLNEPKVAALTQPFGQLEYHLFKAYMDRIVNITVDCCRLLVDLNLYYIESLLTNGINIDRLNGIETDPKGVLRAQEQVQTQAEALPAYAFSPQDYITQIGQHLLALKKQTEKFDQIDNRPLLVALGYLMFTNSFKIDTRACKTVTEIVLKCIAGQIVRSLIGRTTSSVLAQLSVNGRKQISTDAKYLDDVLQDLNLLDTNDPPVEKLKNLILQ